MNFLAELKRRNVIRMAGLYLVGAWLIVQVAATLLPVFEAPSWVMKTLVALLVIGFIPALIISWVFELTPDGLRREDEIAPAEPSDSNAPNTARRMNQMIIVVMALALGYFAFDKFVLVPNRDPLAAAANTAGPINSIAVLPFQNKNSDADTEYLSDGLAESLIYRLAQLPNLKVSPSSSIFRYKGKEIDPVKVGTELNVLAVMTGRLVQRGDDLIISVELLDVRNNKLLWGEQYNRKMSELLATQREIAVEITNKLQLKLSGEGQAKLDKKYTESTEAYQLYLKGRFHWNKRTGESLKQAVEFFNQAIEKDPNYALAYSGLAESYVLFPSYNVALPLESMPKAKAAALRAIALDDSMAETHTALGIYYSNFAWNPPASEKEFRRAIELNPNYAAAYQQFGIECLSATGRFDEAIAASLRAEEIDPVSPIISADFGAVLFKARRFDEAITQLNRAIALDPNFFVSRWYLGQVYHAKGQYAGAIAEFKKALALNDGPWVKALLVRSLAKSGKHEAAVKLLGELQADATRRVVSSASLALAYGAVGERDKAFALLDQEIAERGPRVLSFGADPRWDDIRDDPRFAELIKRVEMLKMD